MKHLNKGRSRQLIRQRDQRLAARFYWYNEIIGLRHEKCLRHLEREFDLRGSRIQDILTQNIGIVRQLEDKKADAAFLKALFPFMVWQYLPATTPSSGVQLSLDLF